MKVNVEKIKEIRKVMGLTPADLAARFDPPVSRQAVESWEVKGVGTFKSLVRIAKALGVNPRILVDMDNGD